MNDVKFVKRFPSGTIHIPASKSILQRAVICAGAAEGTSTIRNISMSDDVRAAAECMQKLSADIEISDGCMRITGSSGKSAAGQLECGESAAVLRFLMPMASVLRDETVFSGSPELMSRPLEMYLDLLSSHGACGTLDKNMLVMRGRLLPGKYQLRGDISSQYVSGLLMALPLLDSPSIIEAVPRLESAGYAALTLDVMEKFGVKAESRGSVFYVPGGSRYKPADIEAEGDYSSAAFFLAAGALGCSCDIAGLNLHSVQGDRRILKILSDSGAEVSVTSGKIRVSTGRLRAQKIDVSDIPDLVPPLAAFFSFCEGRSVMYNASRLRYKESDRLSSVTAALSALGADVKAAGDSIEITGASSLRGGIMNSFNDHRIAMMGAVAAVRSTGSVGIIGSGSVKKSYPDFWRDFEKTEKAEI